jgi:Phage integrase family
MRSGVGDAVLEEVAEPGGRLGQQAHRDADLDVLREDRDADPGMARADLVRGPKPLLGVGRRHADVDERDVRRVDVDLRDDLLAGGRLSHDFEARAPQDAIPSRTIRLSSAITTRIEKGRSPGPVGMRFQVLWRTFGLPSSPRLRGDWLDPSALRRRFVAARDTAGLPALRLHDLRHTAGTLLTRVLDPVTVKDVLGHADLKTTERYLHAIRTSRLADAATRAFSAAPAEDDEEAARSALRAAAAQLGTDEARRLLQSVGQRSR